MQRMRGGTWLVLCSFFLAFIMVAVPCRAESRVTVSPKTVRVCLAQDLQTRDFYVQGKYRLVGQGGELIAAVQPGERWQAVFSGGRIQFFKNGQLVGTHSGPAGLQQDKPLLAVLGGSGAVKNAALDAGIQAVGADGQAKQLKIGPGGIIVAGASGTPVARGGGDLHLVSLSAGGRSQSYRGNMEFRVQAGGITVINELPLEEYLYGVLPREMPAFWPLEAQKAQAVAARSYALAQLGAYRPHGFDLMATQQSQVYGGYNAEHPISSRAVDETRGQVMLYREKPISAYFHSSSGGHIENCQDVWREAVDYIKSRPDPYDKNPNHYNWEATYSQEQLVNQLKEKKGYFNRTGEPEKIFSRVDDVKILERTSSGTRVKKIIIEGQDSGGKPLKVELYNADAVRGALGLKSSLFEIKKETGSGGALKSLTMKGSGFGHGLGMSQYGAFGMASQGYSYQDILKYYYYNVQVGLARER